MPKITLKFKDNVLADYHLPLGSSLKIGRQKDNDVIIDNLAVSGYHGKIDSAGDGFVYVDLKSKNGSFINEERVSSHWLENGDVINIGKHSLSFSYFESESLPGDKQASEMENTMIIDTNEYRSMAEKKDPEPTAAAPPEAKAESTSIAAPPKNNQKKNVRGYLT